ncbi:GntR family transcriptional regulator [Ethanoligenens harbinense]|uniref:Transcriptional regulator, GntR family n=1 Tax=Ethanoligenens harbinense (strain DSM 18485 / JCM 12961 / CGMCC 1.5033 / YUAN-3) TaxID=663278 RepID=E6U4E8_ETHHY|nr:GntR family transcriptional regulator [Ethanoligenens harbinense]ADU27755.1 transcriptional regulator, GntR family [Ethanoligenens harbinense YUAN-3]AVQ96780.1 GntR family transcriptional regulator [Ethanoligenens harbinense YUAN-3]AYF39442.1 GntR family transcriptional regulator [Ethanoligenens harbinense]AYF42266.1 GntR family transcriptional regulator [Ethanoligenens harbinense]QCN93022.1 GntR family transcriptional regulator [Ethanoligenens harbinense]
MRVLPQIGSKNTLVQRAYEAIREAIITNKFKPGQVLAEENLAQELAISRTPVRTALRMLSFERLILINSSRNMVVAGFTEKDIVDITVVRESLETLAASLLATKLTPEQAKELESIIKEQTGCLKKNDFNGFVKCEYEFHTNIAVFTGNTWLSEMVEHVNVILRRYLILSGSLELYGGLAMEEHKMILQGIKSREAGKAEQMMRNHIQNVAERILK